MNISLNVFYSPAFTMGLPVWKAPDFAVVAETNPLFLAQLVPVTPPLVSRFFTYQPHQGSTCQIIEQKPSLEALLESFRKEADGFLQAKIVSDIGKTGQPGAADFLISLMRTSSVTIGLRRAAIAALGETGDERAMEPLIEIYSLDTAAITALGKIPHPNAREFLVRVAQSHEEPCEFRMGAVAALGESRDEALVEPLIKAFNNAKPRNLLEKIVHALGKIGGDRAVTFLLEVLRNGEKIPPNVRKVAASIVAEIGDLDAHEKIFDALAEALTKDVDPRVRIAVIAALKGIKNDRVVPLLIEVLNNDSSAEACDNAATILRDSGDIRAVKPLFASQGKVHMARPALITLLKTPGAAGLLIEEMPGKEDPKSRAAFIDLINRSDEDVVTDLLIRLLEDKTEEAAVRVAAASVFYKTRSISRDIRALIKASNDDVKEVAEMAAYVLSHRQDCHATYLMVGSLKDEDPAVRLYAVNALARLRDADVTEVLIEALSSDPSPEIRTAVIRALASQHGDRSMDAMISALKNDPDAAVRETILNIFYHMRRNLRIMDSVIDAFYDDIDSNVRCAAASLISKSDYVEGPATMLRALIDEDASVRAVAVYGLIGYVGDQKVFDIVVKMLTNDTAADVRRKAAYALRSNPSLHAVKALIAAFDRESDVSVRREIIESLGKSKLRTAMAALRRIRE